MDPAAARRFVRGQELAARRIAEEPRRDPVRDAAALMDALAALGELHPALLERREREDAEVRGRWMKLRRALLGR